MRATSVLVVAGLCLVPGVAAAQHQHGQAGHAATPATAPQAGQSAFAAIAEIIGILEADPTTDWSRVNIEALRQHLIDMNEVTLNASITQTNIEGGYEALVTGSGRTVESIRRMATAHANMVGQESPLRMAVTPVDGGVRVRVTAGAAAAEPRQIDRLRALGFIGLLTVGGHHGPHHLMMARGSMGAAH